MGWLDSRGLNLERYLYTFHRVTGVAVLGYLFLHIVSVGERAFVDATVWKSLIGQGGLYDNLLFHTSQFLIVVFVIFHGLNGLRLILGEVGFSLGRPGKPRYPYRASSLGPKTRLLFSAFMVVAGVIIAIGLMEYLRVLMGGG